MKIFLLPILILIVCFQIFSPETVLENLRGELIDGIGLPIENAIVKIVLNSGKTNTCEIKTEGKFVCEVNFNEGFTLDIEAQDFSILRQTFEKLQDFPQDKSFTLAPLSPREEVQVTAERVEARLSDTPAAA